MLSRVYHCAKCNSTDLVKNGTNASGSQRYKCKNCGTCRVLISKSKTACIDKEAVLCTFEERNSYRSTGRIFNISHTTVFNWLKKKAESLKPFKKTVQAATPETILEVDEIVSYILLKVNQIHTCMSENKQTKQIVSFFIGDGGMESCKKLW